MINAVAIDTLAVLLEEAVLQRQPSSFEFNFKLDEFEATVALSNN